jgi:microcystin-dependent protein
MAIGDAAAAAGLAVVPASEPINKGYERINQKGDELAAVKAQVTALQTAVTAAIPVGTSIQGYWQSAPAGFLLEAGQTLLRTGTYAALFAAIGTIHNNASTPANSFRLPDSRGRVQAALAPAAFGNPDFTFLGGLPGEYNVSLTAVQNGQHSHTVDSVVQGLAGYGLPSQDIGGTVGRGITGGTTTTSSASGSGAPHLNVQPTIIVNRAIKY